MNREEMERPQPVEILLVEDNDDDVLLVRESFAQANITNKVSVVNDGEEALAYLRQEGPYKHVRRPGLVLLDINMPKKDGFEVLQEVKDDPALRHLPIIMLTTSRRDEDIVRSYAEGACSYITKPVRFEEFIQVVKEFALYWTLVSRLPPSK